MMYPANYKFHTISEYIKERDNSIDENTRENQNKRILQYLMENGSITQDEADELKVRRLSARIFDLRNQGHDIVTDTIYDKNEYGPTRFAKYRMVV